MLDRIHGYLAPVLHIVLRLVVIAGGRSAAEMFICSLE